ncbi:biotin/lipoyl-containing protein [Streptomyces sp. NPDC057376]|uniref:biotin/lipoyl-containing protein n=1 Tax=Streptomyces sp. NPDC057376 TaxID=3346110 RepID=UPI003636379D
MAEIVPLNMPKLSMAATEATFLEWLVEDGAVVTEGEPIYTVATDKVDSEVEAPASGILRHGDVKEETDYPVGTRIGSIEPSA